MSAFLVDKTHIRVMVTVAAGDTYNRIPPMPGDMIRRYPEAFPYFVRGGGGNPAWLENLISAPLQNGWRGFEDELGRALWLANDESVRYRYRETDTPNLYLTELVTYKHVMTRRPMVDVIKACHCFAYQACELPDWQSSWAKKACDAIEAIAIHSLPGYDAAPWGIPDPDGGARDDGPVSLLSLLK